jgi:hypothetical protein
MFLNSKYKNEHKPNGNNGYVIKEQTHASTKYGGQSNTKKLRSGKESNLQWTNHPKLRLIDNSNEKVQLSARQRNPENPTQMQQQNTHRTQNKLIVIAGSELSLIVRVISKWKATCRNFLCGDNLTPDLQIVDRPPQKKIIKNSFFSTFQLFVNL